MSITRPLPSSDEAILVEREYTNEVPADAARDGELSDLDLEEVLGGLERVHFPDPIDLPQSAT